MVLAEHRIWRPSPSDPLDIEATIEAWVRDLCTRYRVVRVLVDPWQMARSIRTLSDARLPVEEFPQTEANLTRMGQAL